VTAQYTPNDPLYGNQWHLALIGRLGFTAGQNFAGLERIWAEHTGEGIKVGIWDDGVESDHWDLDGNYESGLHVRVSGTLNDGQPLTASDGHGTAVAGLIAAENNGSGGVGVAFDASVTGIRIFGGADDINSSWSRYLKTLDSLDTFDVTNHSYGGTPNFYHYGDEAKFEAAAEDGRGGLGTVNVKSAGNDNIDGNGEGLDASRFTVTVGAVDSDGQVKYYSTYGAHLLVSAPAGSYTTDLQENGNGYDGLLGGDYTHRFGGTSASSPVTAGLVSLILDANEGLGWRDVQNILSYSSVGTGSLYSNSTAYENHSWKWNGADNWNGGGLHYSEDYGYGVINAFNAVRMAEVWSEFNPAAATSANEQSVTTGTVTANKTIVDLATLSFSFMVSQSIALEHVALTISLTHSYFTDLRMDLTSPDGTQMSFYDGSSGNSSTSDNGMSYTFGLDGYRGENSYGQWTVQIEDTYNSDEGILHSIGFTGYGASLTEDDVYHYTDEVLAAQAEQAGRGTLTDSDGGVDWIDASAMHRDLVLNLSEGSTSTLAGTAFLTIALGTTIEHAIAGDGDDRITGNDEDNSLYGMRGDDVMDGGEGTDTAVFFGNLADYTITSENGVTTISGAHGTDTLTNFEYLKFDDQTIEAPAAGPDETAPELVSSNLVDAEGGFDTDAPLVLVFDETIKLGTGFVTIHNADGSVWRTIDVTDGSQISISGSSLNIHPLSDLSFDSSYYVTLDAGAVLDTSDNAFEGISDPELLNFFTASQYNFIAGDSRNNRINGTEDDDLIQGDAGNDRLDGKDGDDILNGGSGNDRLTGGDGSDTASYAGTSGDVTVTLETTRAQNTGAAGRDTLRSIENLTGGDGDDTLTGNSDANILSGGAGDDTLRGGLGDDFLDGGADVDTAVYTSSMAASQITYDGASGLFTISGPDGTDTLSDIEFFQFSDGTLEAADLTIVALSDGDDVHAGDATDERIDGLAGDDEIDGAGGADALFGGDDDDTLTGGADDDRLVGGNGTDTAVFSGNRTDYVISYADGIYTIEGPDGRDTLEGIEYLAFDDGTIATPSIVTIAGLQSSAVEGDADSVELTFEVRLDKAAASEQSVRYAIAGSGPDAADAADFSGNALPGGTIVFAAGVTSQIITIEVAGDLEEEMDETFSVTLDNPSDALLIGTQSATGTIISDDVVIPQTHLTDGRDRYNGTSDADWVFGLEGNDRLDGKDGDDILNGGSGNDRLTGGDGSDTASYAGTSGDVTVTLETTRAQNTGAAGRDTLRSIENLTGGDGDDTLTGNSDANILSGGAGDDTLLGGGGGDTFVFKSGDGDDTIDDFSTGQGDIMDISAYGFSSIADFSDFRFEDGDTVVDLDADNSITISNVDLTSAINAEDSFLFG
jgi:Ca2+-binding RTX toxin-like protein/subtilisin-like proprotein convertase family protein